MKNCYKIHFSFGVSSLKDYMESYMRFLAWMCSTMHYLHAKFPPWL